MPQLQTLDQQILARKQIQVFYDIEGEPLYALVPLKRRVGKRSVSEILKESAAKAKTYDITDRETVKIVDEVREKLFNKHYAQKV